MENTNMKSMHRPFFSVLTGLSAGTLFLLSSCPSPSTTPPPPPNPREAAAPNFSLKPGTYFGTQTLEITSDTPGAVIRFVLQEGASAPDPTPESPAYTGPVELKEGTPGNPKSYTLSARAFKDGMTPSPVVRALYRIDAPKARVEITPEAGNLYGTQQLTMSSPDGAEIRYESAQGLAADGTTPNNPTREPIQGNVSDGSGSPIYDTSATPPATIPLTQGTVETPNIYTYWIRAFKDGLNPGDIIKLTFRVYPPKAGTLEPTLDAGNYRGNKTLKLTLKDADPAAAIVYTFTQTTDGSEPAEPADPTQDITSTGSTEYDSAAGIPLNAPTSPLASDLPNIFIVKARAFAAGKVPSDILRLRCEIRAPKVEPVVIEDEPGDTFGRTLLRLTTATTGTDVEIRYTLTNDGTEPAEPVQGAAPGGSPIYDPAAPPSIKPDALNQLKTFRIKARAFKPGFLPSDVSPVESFPLKVTVKQIYAGGYESATYNVPSTLFLLLEDGSLWGVGDNRHGQLGNGDPTSTSSPTVTTFTRVMEGAGKPLTNAKEVTGSWKFTAVLKNDGTVYTFGDNTYGQLGRGDSPAVTDYAVKVSGMSDIVSIAAGMDHLILVNQSGGAFAAGRGDSGQLATSAMTFPNKRSTFESMVRNFDVTNIARASAGHYHSVLLTKNSEVLAAGRNSEGQLGLTTTANKNVLEPVRAASGLGTLSGVVDIGGFNNHTLFVLKENKQLLGTGANNIDQLGFPSTVTSSVTRPTALGIYSGSNIETAITNVAKLPRSTQINDFSFYIDTQGRVHASGYRFYDQFPDGSSAPALSRFTQVPGIQNIRSVIAANSAYMVFLLTDGSLRVTHAAVSPLKDYAEGSGNGLRNVNPLR